jgi:hypothetical protein
MFLPPKPAEVPAESMVSVPVIEPVEAAAPPEPSSLLTNEETKAPEMAKKPKVKKKPQGQFGWKQTGISLSEGVILRLKLESFKSGKTLSEIADSLLARHLPNHKISA